MANLTRFDEDEELEGPSMPVTVAWNFFALKEPKTARTDSDSVSGDTFNAKAILFCEDSRAMPSYV
jgi:hypothetical protein